MHIFLDMLFYFNVFSILINIQDGLQNNLRNQLVNFKMERIERDDKK